VATVVVKDEIDGVWPGSQREALADLGAREAGALQRDAGFLREIGECDDPAALRPCLRANADQDDGHGRRDDPQRPANAPTPASARDRRRREHHASVTATATGCRRWRRSCP